MRSETTEERTVFSWKNVMSLARYLSFNRKWKLLLFQILTFRGWQLVGWWNFRSSFHWLSFNGNLKQLIIMIITNYTTLNSLKRHTLNSPTSWTTSKNEISIFDYDSQWNWKLRAFNTVDIGYGPDLENDPNWKHDLQSL